MCHFAICKPTDRQTDKVIYRAAFAAKNRFGENNICRTERDLKGNATMTHFINGDQIGTLFVQERKPRDSCVVPFS